MTEEQNTGCFAWCVRFKQACNKRWARAINRLRRHFYARRGQRVDPEKVLDETGARDMMLSKTYIDIPDIFAAKFTDTAGPLKNNTVNDQDFDIQVSEYVTRIIQAAADILTTEEQLSNVVKMDADDNISLTSSVISHIADITVTESLSTVAMDNNINQSAARNQKTRPELEFIGLLGDVVAIKDAHGFTAP